MINRLTQFFFANFGTKIISVIVAIVLWVIVLGSRVVEVTKEVPLEILTSSEVIASNDIPEKIAFKLSGPKAFLRTIFDRREDPIRINLTGEKAGLVTRRFFSDNIRVPIGVKVQGITPAAILIKLEPVKKRDVPVRFETRGTVPEGYKVEKVSLVPEVITIKGAESKVESITEIIAQPIDVQGLRQSLTREVAIDLNRYGVQVDGALPKANIEVAAVSANFRLRNVEIKIMSSGQAKADEKTVTVWVRADNKTIKLLDRGQVQAWVDVRGKAKGTHTERIKVKLPNEVGLVKLQPEMLKVTVY